MKLLKFSCLLIALLTGTISLSQKRTNNNQPAKSETINQSTYDPANRPNLVVGIVVDQMRYDYLTRFYDRYSNDGFKRLMKDGFNATNNHYNYVPTYTAPGHASIYTGTTPENHGIIGNNWYDKFIDKTIYNADDADANPIGTTSDEGKMSPRKLLSSTVTDELELFTQGRAKVIGISIKDRGAILPAGHAADAAYWFRGGDEGIFITSDFYMNSLPKWVTDFNSSKPAEKYLKPWETLYPVDSYFASGPDLNDFERAPRGKDTATFPYDLKQLAASNGDYNLIKSTPYGNTIVADFAIAALENEQMGRDVITDFLAVSFSSTDYVGHQYGVNSVEIEDTYLRLDKDIARLLEALDKNVGNDNYTVFLTADHGAVNVPAYLQQNKFSAGYFDERTFVKQMDTLSSEKFQVQGLIKNVSNDQIFFDQSVLESAGIDATDLQNYLATQIRNYPGVNKVFTRDAMVHGSFTNGMAALIQKGFHHQRSGDVIFVLDPGTIVYPNTGSTHGSAQSYDTHVPLLFYGKGINKGTTADRTHITDIAPTISSLLGISFPNSATGNPIGKVLK
ncbi:Predicted pyrophosphatase or phosphodiesterase, AlkP superfamily [Nonlabens sp. Hel1_33_55]|uniref:alkaline phosphatase PafA n=1 Tax=Nonlabens sp. Hel1_33_55 TaxID=1336802 RepID=UPI000875AEF3|nr:alkaline phosphatase PafA [Nonlabens sp. Hel1_33_55]SCY16033.1 Predicted pyrophosphatase or phosphodiesterase, AlkP superfamily [Nonlabens sp. Hel1_33_55]